VDRQTDRLCAMHNGISCTERTAYNTDDDWYKTSRSLIVTDCNRRRSRNASHRIVRRLCSKPAGTRPAKSSLMVNALTTTFCYVEWPELAQRRIYLFASL